MSGWLTAGESLRSCRRDLFTRVLLFFLSLFTLPFSLLRLLFVLFRASRFLLSTVDEVSVSLVEDEEDVKDEMDEEEVDEDVYVVCDVSGDVVADVADVVADVVAEVSVGEVVGVVAESRERGRRRCRTGGL